MLTNQANFAPRRANAVLQLALRVSCTATLLVISTLRASEPDGKIRFERDIRPILKEHCFHCHGEGETYEGGLDLRLVRFIKRGGDSGASLIPGHSSDSILVRRLVDKEMPPDESKQLGEAEVNALRRWIDEGALTVRPEPEHLEGGLFITQEELEHWAYQPLTRPPVPQVQERLKVANPIDAFLLAELEKQGFSFAERDDRNTLLRRLSFDLHGTPPSVSSLNSFLNDSSSDAWITQVDQALAGYSYGERWARHWLDVAGYADSEGYNDADQIRPHAWRFRDYVIRSFQADKPYDQFITEQLAGDELLSGSIDNLDPHDVDLLEATGFLRMAPDGTGGSVPDRELARNEVVAETIKVVSSSLLAMTVGCAQCHDHRYDPISHENYYQFRAIFEPALNPKQWKKPQQRLLSLYDDADRAAAEAIEAEAKAIEAERLKAQQKFIDATFEKQVQELPEEIREAARQARQTSAAERTDAQKSLLKKHPSLNVTAGSLYLYDKKAADELKSMQEEASKKRSQKPVEHFVRALAEDSADQLPPTKIFARGDHEQPQASVEPAGLKAVSLVANVPDVPTNDEQRISSGRRLAFAQRITDSQHPLTARVIVNRLWLHHFGQGLVATPNDFGELGSRPKNQALLDWLACELIESDWSLKHMHRLILSSNAWCQSTETEVGLVVADPDNQLFGRANLRRVDAEVLRDSMLWAAGQLNRESFGPPVPVMADRVGRWVVGQENLNAGRPGAKIDLHGAEYRRSIYIQVRRSRPLSVLDSFDLPAMTPNCDRRRPSTGAVQSLMMLNSDLVVEYSRLCAERLRRECGDDSSDQIALAWRLIYSREPTPLETEMASAFLASQKQLIASEDEGDEVSSDALALLCQMLFSSNEFLYVN